MKQIFLITALILSLGFAFSACNSGDNANKAGSTTNPGKQEQLAQGEMYTCTMHNEVMSNNPGTCPKCGMTLTKQKMTPEQEKMMKEGTYVKSKEEQ